MLRVFEAAARHLSLTRAGDELFLTQGAVSKQIKALENHIGRSLFVRIHRGLVLTPCGEGYYRDIAPLLAGIDRATEKLLGNREVTKLTLYVLSSLGERWLIERIARFVQANPDIDLKLTAMLSSDGKNRCELDGEFRFGLGSWPGETADHLFGEETLLVASPALLSRLGEIESSVDIFMVPHAWDELIDSIPELSTASKTGPFPQAAMYEYYNVLIRAAVVGLGLAVIPRVWIKNELASGQLVNPLCLGVTSKYGYYFVVPEGKSESPAVLAFRDWLRLEAKQTQEELLLTSSERVLSLTTS
jgi:LysR family glycine cleavage system transcriptional activator